MATVSILLPVYNAEKYLSEAIDSVLAQTLIDWELLLIDDGSTDNSIKILEEYAAKDSRIKIYNNDNNLGLIATLNRGVELCKGDYIARMDADDIMVSNRLEKQVLFLEHNRSYGMCGTNAITIDENGDEIGHIINLSSDELLRINLLFSVPFVHPSIMFRKEIFNDIEYDLEYKHVEDYDLWVRFSTEWKIANLPEFLFKYRWHDKNVSVVHKEYQEKMKHQIILRQLAELELEPDAHQIEAHELTFKLYDKGQKLDVSIDSFHEIEDWFSRIIWANKEKQVYENDQLIAFLWARWMVLCVSQKRYFKAIPSFVKFTPKVFKTWVGIMKVLRKK